MDERRWQGIGVSAGKASGRTWVMPAADLVIELIADSGSADLSQSDRLEQAIERTDEEIRRLEEKVQAEQGETVAQIFSAHRLLLSDPCFAGEMQSRLKAQSITAEQAVKSVADEAASMLSALDDPYMQERASDILDVARQLINNLSGNGEAEGQFPIEGNWIVVAEELTPAQTISLPKERVAAFIVHKGGKTSHTAILARTYGIPAVIGVNNNWEKLMKAAGVELDGEQGWIRELSETEVLNLEPAVGVNSTMELGADLAEDVSASLGITLAANIGSPSDISLIKRFNAQGVGLYRTEFLFMGEKLPTEEEQVEAYTQVIKASSPEVTIIRTLDIGGDKKAPALELPSEKNPFLGVRALRLCFKKPELFETQLRAIWRASAAGNVAVMFPMISSLDELRIAKEYLARAKQLVIKQGYLTGNLQVGIMIEVPAAVWLAGKLAKEVDFFSIGTNDLIQYSLAVDRENEEVADLYQAYHPAVLGMIAEVSRAAKAAGIWTGICGEAGGDQLLAPFFVGLGIEELSMSPGLLPKMRQMLAAVHKEEVVQENLVAKVLECSTASEVLNILKRQVDCHT